MTSLNDGPSGSERMRCPHCGANNFKGTLKCWQCSANLGETSHAASAPRIAIRQDADLANKAAAALGLMFPYIGIPVGMVFLMLDDARKTRLGWLTITWSIVGTVLNAVIFFASVLPFIPSLRALTPHLPSSTPSIPGLQ